MPYPSKEARNTALKAQRDSPGHQVAVRKEKRLRLIVKIEALRLEIMGIATAHPELRSEVPPQLVDQETRMPPTRTAVPLSTRLTEPSAWNLLSLNSKGPEHIASLSRHKRYCVGAGISFEQAFPSFEEEWKGDPRYKRAWEHEQFYLVPIGGENAVGLTPEEEVEYQSLLKKYLDLSDDEVYQYAELSEKRKGNNPLTPAATPATIPGTEYRKMIQELE